MPTVLLQDSLRYMKSEVTARYIEEHPEISSISKAARVLRSSRPTIYRDLKSIDRLAEFHKLLEDRRRLKRIA
jgi:hypothetical protein